MGEECKGGRQANVFRNEASTFTVTCASGSTVWLGMVTFEWAVIIPAPTATTHS